MNSDLVRLAHTAMNPDTIRRMVEEVGATTAIRRLRSSPSTHPSVRASLDVDAAERLDALSSMGVDLLAREDERFPDWLASLPDSPLWLFTRGEVLAEPGVAIVGSRQATRYGMDVAHTLGARIAAAGWVVVSGLARGIDTAAHRGALAGNGLTVAVLGSGIDVWYPRQNHSLGEELVACSGGVISEFPPGTAPEPWRFPARNRIISGLVGVVIVVEAAAKSGALITARCALDHDRFVMAVPGDLSRETSVGTNLLIRDGAHPLTELDVVIEEIELVLGPAPIRTVGEAPTGVDSELLALLALLGSHSIPIDQLAEESGMVVSALLAQLTTLELSGLIQLDGGFVRKR